MSDQITEEQYKRLRREVEDAKTEADRAKGALEQLMKSLKSEFQCDGLKEAKVLLEELKIKRDKAQKKFEQSLKDYEKKWKEEQ